MITSRLLSSGDLHHYLPFVFSAAAASSLWWPAAEWRTFAACWRPCGPSISIMTASSSVNAGLYPPASFSNRSAASTLRAIVALASYSSSKSFSSASFTSASAFCSASFGLKFGGEAHGIHQDERLLVTARQFHQLPRRHHLTGDYLTSVVLLPIFLHCGLVFRILHVLHRNLRSLLLPPCRFHRSLCGFLCHGNTLSLKWNSISNHNPGFRVWMSEATPDHKKVPGQVTTNPYKNSGVLGVRRGLGEPTTRKRSTPVNYADFAAKHRHQSR